MQAHPSRNRSASAPESIGQQLRELRKSRGMKMSWVAAQLGISNSALSLMETGHRHFSAERVEMYKRAIGG